MSWDLIGSGWLGINWNAKNGAALVRCDPYLVWQDAVARVDLPAGSAADGELREICVLIEKRAHDDVLQDVLLEDIRLNHGHQIYSTNFLTVYMAAGPRPLRRLVKAVISGRIKRLMLQTARRLPGLQSGPDNDQRLRVQRPPSKPAASLELFWSLKSRPKATPVIGIIDDVCPYTNAAFWQGGEPRLTALWQQDGEPVPSGSPVVQSKAPTGAGTTAADGEDIWAPVRRSGGSRPLPGSGEGEPAGADGVVLFAHGRELSVQRLNGLRQTLGEREMRKRVDRDGPDARRSRAASAEVAQRADPLPQARPLPRFSHGSHVMSIASGLPDPLMLRHLAVQPVHPLPVAFVQLPQQVVNDTSSGSLAAHALDGIHYLLDHAGGNPLVVNLSYGIHGDHDGRSMFERALCELLTANPNLHVVLPAGNSHLLQGHVRAGIAGAAADAARRRHTLYWRVLPDDPTDGYLEVWLPPNTQVTIRIKPPGRSEPFALAAGEARLMRDDDGQIMFGGIYPSEAAQSDWGTMVLIAVSPTRRLPQKKTAGAAPLRLLGSLLRFRDESLAPHGIWELEVENLGTDAFAFHAWIERDDAAPYMPARKHHAAGRQSYFMDRPKGAVAPESTLNGIATAEHPQLHVIGAMQRGSSLRGGGPLPFVPHLSDYSGAGPNRDGKRADGPDAITMADDTRSLPGLLGGGLLSGSRQRMNGTSVAAALYTRMLADELAAGRLVQAPFALPLDLFRLGRESPVFPNAPRPAFPLQRGIGRRIRS